MNPALVEGGQARIDALKAADPTNTAPIPVDLVTASGSGSTRNQRGGGAIIRSIACGAGTRPDRAAVKALVDKYTQGRQFGFLGEPTGECTGTQSGAGCDKIMRYNLT